MSIAAVRPNPALALLAILSLPAAGAPDRGVWFWGSTTLPTGAASSHGSADVVGDGPEEDAAIAFMLSYGIKRVFGSYQNRPVSEPAVIAAWNAKLDAAGIESQLLLDGNAVNDPVYMADIQAKVTNRLITFNTTVAPDEASRFDALHLDLEPQQLNLWKTDTVGTDKRALLTDLADAYAAIRTQLDTAGLTTTPIHADINFSWDKLPTDGGSVAWADPTDRDTWYAGIGDDLAGITVMTFSKDNAPDLATATAFERGGVFPGSVVVGMQPRTGIGELWPNHSAFYGVMTQLESDIGTAEATDIENYAYWRHAVATQIPSLAAAPEVIAMPFNGGGGGGGVVVVEAKPGHKFSLEENDDPTRPQRWSEVEVFTSSFPDRVERFEHPFTVTPPRMFWRVVRSPLTPSPD